MAEKNIIDTNIILGRSMVDNLIDKINELQSITSYRTRFYTEIHITSEFFDLKQKLLFINKIRLDDDYLHIITDHSSVKLKVTSDLTLEYICDEPVIDEKERFRMKLNRKKV